MADDGKELKLFSVTTVHSELRVGSRVFEGVHVCWVVEGREKPAGQYADLIELDHVRCEYTRGFVDECFTVDEVQQLFGYLALRDDQTEIRIERMETPIKGGCAPIACCPPDMDWSPAKHDKNYNLPFQVCAYFSVDGCEGRPLTDEEFQEDKKPEPAEVPF